jgi:ATP-dependent DNA helicase RecG
VPTGTIDRRAQPKLADVVPGQVVTVAVTIDAHRKPSPNRPRAPFLVYASDETGTLTVAYFSPRRDMIEKLLPVGSRRYVSGTVAVYDGMLQMAHPDRVADEAGFAAMALVEPVYPLTEGLTANMVRRHIAAALGRMPAMPEWLDRLFVARAGWPDFAAALEKLHRPAEPADVAPDGKARSRLAYDEVLACQLALALVRAHLRRSGSRRTPAPSPRLPLGRPRPSSTGYGEGRGEGARPQAQTRGEAPSPGAQQRADLSPQAGRGEGGGDMRLRCTPGEGELKPSLLARLHTALPFRLTRSQRAAIADISSDLAKSERMLHLLQGDVGSGKTVVALFACAAAINAGAAGAPGAAGPSAQAALMAPTEILARQHFKTIAPLAEAAGIRAAILTGRERGTERTRLLDHLREGDIDLLIGTHALYSDDVAFRDLALAVIDEQHRFGVEQRLALARKGRAVGVPSWRAPSPRRAARPAPRPRRDPAASGSPRCRPAPSSAAAARTTARCADRYRPARSGCPVRGAGCKAARNRDHA